MLDWLGDVTSTVSSCQLSGGVCYPTNLCADCRLRMDPYRTYDVCKLYILYCFFEWYFVCVYFVFVLFYV